MGEPELKIALQREGEAQVRSFWEQAEELVAARRQEIAAKQQQLRAESDRKFQLDASTLRNNLLFSSQARAMESRLHAEAELEERLLLLARRILPELAAEDRVAIWTALYKELPESKWAALKTHPADRELAERILPEARLESDELLGGGLIATNDDGTIRIDNSLNCRLLRAWPDLLPKLLAELRKRVDKDEATHSHTAG